MRVKVPFFPSCEAPVISAVFQVGAELRPSVRLEPRSGFGLPAASEGLLEGRPNRAARELLSLNSDWTTERETPQRSFPPPIPCAPLSLPRSRSLLSLCFRERPRHSEIVYAEEPNREFKNTVEPSHSKTSLMKAFVSWKSLWWVGGLRTAISAFVV